MPGEAIQFEKFLWVICKFLGIFKIFVRNENLFLIFFLHFLNLDSILNNFKKKVTLIPHVFLILRTRKNVFIWMSKKYRFRQPFDKYHGIRTKTLLKSEPLHLYHIDWSLWKWLGLKKSLLIIFKMLGLFVNPLTVDDKYCLLKRGNLLQHFQMQLSQKRKTFAEFFFAFSEFRFNFERFRKRMTLPAHVFLNLQNYKKG